jgi:hypothetical protein
MVTNLIASAVLTKMKIKRRKKEKQRDLLLKIELRRLVQPVKI